MIFDKLNLRVEFFVGLICQLAGQPIDKLNQQKIL